MTDRHAGYIAALCMIRGVARVEAVIADAGLHIAEARADQRWRERIFTLIRRPEAVDQLNHQGRA